MRLVDLDAGSPVLDTVYEELLRPSFTTDKLLARTDLGSELASGLAVVSVALDDQERPVGVAAGQWSPATGILLLDYLAVRNDLRSGGVGRRLMGRVQNDWQRKFEPLLTLTEVQHPLAHLASPEYGDPTARLRFYARHGGLALDLPYVQPPSRPDTGRVYGVLLLDLPATGAAPRGQRETVPATPVAGMLREGFQAAEGSQALHDLALAPMWQAAEGREHIRLLPLDDPLSLPLSTPG